MPASSRRWSRDGKSCSNQAEEGLRLIRNYRRPLFPYRRRTALLHEGRTSSRRWSTVAAKGWNQRLGGVWPSAKKRAAGCARVSPPILYRRGRKGWRVACTRIIPRPICRRSIHYSADPWPRRSSVDFDRARNSSLCLFLWKL